MEFEGETQPGQPGPAGAPGRSAAATPVVNAPIVEAAPPTVSAPANRGESLVARPGDAPPADPATAPRQPGEPEPGGATEAPPVSAPVSDIPPIRPGEIVCPVCGWGNEPTRRFCRHDGAVLGVSATPRGQPPALKAGQRQRRSGGGRGPWIVVALLVPALLAAAVLGVIYLRPGGDKPTKADSKASPKPTPSVQAVAVPAGAVAVTKFSSQSGGRQATNLLDGDPTTFWSAAFPARIPNNPRPDIDRRPFVKFTFDPAVTIVRVDVRNGAAGAEFGKRSRARRIFLEFPDGTSQAFELADQGTEFQTIAIKKPAKVDSIVIHVSTSYVEGTSTKSGDRFRFSLNDVRFFMAS